MTALWTTCMLLQLGADPTEEALRLYQEHTFRYTGGQYTDHEFKYRLLAPEPLDQETTWPVVFFLHGAGERGDDNAKQLMYLPSQLANAEHRAKYPAFVVVPQCPAGQFWVRLRPTNATPDDPDEPPHAMQIAIGILDHVLDAYPVDRRRIYLTGLSMGGFGSWDLASRYSERFAAVVPICGGGPEPKADRLIKVPIWAFHGADDKIVPVARSRGMIEAIRSAGGEPKYTELEGVGHNSWTPAYDRASGLLDWMFSQVNTRPGD